MRLGGYLGKNLASTIRRSSRFPGKVNGSSRLLAPMSSGIKKRARAFHAGGPNAHCPGEDYHVDELAGFARQEVERWRGQCAVNVPTRMSIIIRALPIDEASDE